jgi:hypothetical protein
VEPFLLDGKVAHLLTCILTIHLDRIIRNSVRGDIYHHIYIVVGPEYRSRGVGVNEKSSSSTVMSETIYNNCNLQLWLG